ncbi:helix-turn-helix domain-containing protein [Luteibacter aegosomatis]|uniref:helix-turn-helix domain-containing protein n=1 Tax=Luteibacter aegosomatis TaxID=2911537 RepID=UPI001FF777AB|nr:helix-turn-helix domain-containing protein [Luteibacter aegosomatis]UPG87075.1 helix-turn-helix domain-containing protein [Luteibacter aegosomatis]
MATIVDVLSGNPGVGKTQTFIEGIDPAKRYVYASPTRQLASEVMQRLDQAEKPYTPIFTGQTKDVGSVIHQANLALNERKTPLLIITHKCLASVKPELLEDWELFIDESPKPEEITCVGMASKEYERVIAPYVGDCDDDGGLILNQAMLEEAWEIHAQGIEDAKNNRTRNKTLLLVLDAMLSPTKTVTATPNRNDKGKETVLVRVEGFTDFTRCFEHAASVTIMGANVDRSLVAKHALRKGFKLNVIKKKMLRKGLPHILPLVRDQEGAFVSKRMLMTMPDGSVATEWNSECFGNHAIERAIRYINGNPAIFASHEWCKPDLPKHVERTPFDTRGLNEWKDKRVSIHILHGNPSPDEYGPAVRIMQKMGIPLQEGREAMRWAREDDQLIQFAHRTSARIEESDEDTWHIVTSYTQARKLALDFDGSCLINTCLMIDPPKRLPTEAQDKRHMERENLALQAKTLKAQGMSIRDIAQQLGVSKSKVCRLM